MARAESIRAALDAVLSAEVELSTLVEAFHQVALPDDLSRTPPWLYITERHVERHRLAAESLERLLRQDVIPFFEAIERAQ